MNYRHIYHAGNFADIFKHIILTLIIGYMQRKPAAFRILDTHAGAGFYDLRTEAANKTGEYISGIHAFLKTLGAEAESAAGPADDADFFAEAAARYPLLAPYMQALAAAQNAQGAKAEANELKYYPGSPWLARYLLRKQDRLTAIELHKTDYQQLKQRLGGDYQTKTLELNGWLALKAQLPPKEKRGLILIDPPFERADEFLTLANSITEALRRFPQGVYMAWYPVKNYREIEHFAALIAQNAAACGAGDVLQAELRIRRPSPVSAPKLDGSGLILINPPYILTDALRSLEPLLLKSFAEDSHAALKLKALSGQNTGGGSVLI